MAAVPWSWWREPAGIGKSALLGACAQRAADLGMETLRARGDDVSMESSFAVMRELLAPAVGPDTFSGSAALAAPVFLGEAAIGSEADRAVAVLHGLYWLDRRPFATAARWRCSSTTRTGSIRRPPGSLVYLARRIESLPAVLVVAVRRGRGGRAGGGAARAGGARPGAAPAQRGGQRRSSCDASSARAQTRTCAVPATRPPAAIRSICASWWPI